MNKTIKSGIVAILCCGAICSGHSSGFPDEETREAIGNVRSLFGNVIQRVWKERKEAADDGLRPLFRTFGPVASPSLWARNFKKEFELWQPPQDRITLASLIDEYTGNNLAYEDIAHPEAGPLWEKFRIIAREMIPVISQFDDLEHSLLWQNAREYIMHDGKDGNEEEDKNLTKAFACGWEADCNTPPSSQLSTFIDHFRTYLFGDYIAMIEHYMRDWLIPALGEISQLPDLEVSVITNSTKGAVSKLQAYRSALDLIIDRQIITASVICKAYTNVNGGITGCMLMLVLNKAVQNHPIWPLATSICEVAEALRDAICRGLSFRKEILLPFTLSLPDQPQEESESLQPAPQ
jgi:hypothetical protein